MILIPSFLITCDRQKCFTLIRLSLPGEYIRLKKSKKKTINELWFRLDSTIFYNENIFKKYPLTN